MSNLEDTKQIRKRIEHADVHDDWWVPRTLMKQTAPSP